MSSWTEYPNFPNKSGYSKHFTPLPNTSLDTTTSSTGEAHHDRIITQLASNDISTFTNAGYTVSLAASPQQKCQPHGAMRQRAALPVPLQRSNYPRYGASYTCKKEQHSLWMRDRNMKKYPILPPCSCRIKKCYNKISPEDRIRIHQDFWNQNYFCRRLWIYTRIKKIPVKRSKKNPISGTGRACSRNYYLDTHHGEVLNVCQKYFLATLGYKNDKIITHTMTAFQEGCDVDVVEKIKLKSAARSILTKAKHQLQNKSYRMEGKQVVVDKRRSSALSECEVIERNRTKYPLLPACQCKRTCLVRISEERRKSVHLQFWCLSYGRRKQWLFKSILTMPIKRPNKTTISGNNRTCSRQYFLTDARGIPVNVCQKFFLSTLGYSNDKIIVHTMSTVDAECALAAEPPTSNRGKHAPKHKLKPGMVQLMKTHIMSYYQPGQLQYARSATMLYEPRMSVRKLHRHFLMVHTNVAQLPSYESYRTVMEAMDLRRKGRRGAREAGVETRKRNLAVVQYLEQTSSTTGQGPAAVQEVCPASAVQEVFPDTVQEVCPTGTEQDVCPATV